MSLSLVQAICTALTLIAMAPLGELFFFHMILIRKGITTYDYVIAVRTQSEPPVNEQHSLQSSPFSSAPTAISAALGLQYKGAWRTPPQITANNSDNIKPHLEILSYVDPDALEPSESAKRAMKTPVRISAWKLAKLDSNEAMRAAAKARASSSVLRPINSQMDLEADHVSSSRNTSGINSYAGTPTSFHLKGSCPPSRASMEDQELNSPPVKKAQQDLTTKYFNPIFQSSMNRNIASDGENGMLSSGGLSPAAAITSSSVYWDQKAGRFVSSQNAMGSSSSSMTANQTEFAYSEQSILFDGSISNERTRNSINDNDLLNQQQQPYRVGVGRGSSQLAVFVPRIG